MHTAANSATASPFLYLMRRGQNNLLNTQYIYSGCSKSTCTWGCSNRRAAEHKRAITTPSFYPYSTGCRSENLPTNLEVNPGKNHACYGLLCTWPCMQAPSAQQMLPSAHEHHAGYPDLKDSVGSRAAAYQSPRASTPPIAGKACNSRPAAGSTLSNHPSGPSLSHLVWNSHSTFQASSPSAELGWTALCHDS